MRSNFRDSLRKGSPAFWKDREKNGNVQVIYSGKTGKKHIAWETGKTLWSKNGQHLVSFNQESVEVRNY